MHAHLVHAAFLSLIFCFTHAIPSDPSVTVSTTGSNLPTVTAKARINGTVHQVEIGEKLAVKPAVSSSCSTPVKSIAPSSSGKPNGTAAAKDLKMAIISDDVYTINYKDSDFRGSTYCNPRYKSFWYNDWNTDPVKRPAACNAVAYNSANQLGYWGDTQMQNDDIFYGPEKDGTNVCYWHFTCMYEENVEGDIWAEGPEISYQNVKNIAKEWYDPKNWPNGKSPKACGHIRLNKKNSENQCMLTISIIPVMTGVLAW